MAWWDGLVDERYWLEITDRPDLGVDLKAPQLGDNGRPFWSYSAVTAVNDGDVVFHYYKPDKAIVAVSRAVGSAWEEDIVWAAHGTVARDAGVQPYRRPGWRIGLDGFTALRQPLTLDDIRAEEEGLRLISEAIEATHGGPLYFPFAISDKRPVRPVQGYLAKLPEDVVAWFDALGNAVSMASPASAAPSEVAEFGTAYRGADEDAATSERDAFSVDPSLVERGLRGHAATQNQLARWLAAQDLTPLSPLPTDPNFDLAWVVGEQRFVAEVKSTTASNEEKQLRLGLGQVLRYRHLLGPKSVAVLVAERKPTDSTWVELAESLGVHLVWPGSFEVLLPLN